MADNVAHATIIAQLLAGDPVNVSTIDSLPDPWQGWARELAALHNGQRAKRWASIVAGIDNGHDMQQQVLAAKEALLQPPKHVPELGRRLRAEVAKLIQEIAPECPDPNLRWAVTEVFEGLHDEPILALLGQDATWTDEKGKKHTNRASKDMRRQEVIRQVLGWLREHGFFVQSDTQILYYFWRDQRRLFRIDTDAFWAWLYSLAGCNPAGTDFAHLLADCRRVAQNSPTRPVVRLAAWDAQRQVLMISRFDGTVYEMDGAEIREVGNGEDGVIFDDDPFWRPYEPIFNQPGALSWLIDDLPSWGADRQVHALACKCWLLSLFLPELCPTKPLTLLVGEKGSGKTYLLRLILRLLFGGLAEVGGIPDKPDGFTAAAATTHLYVLDNLDEFTPWLRDKLARLSSGADDVYRKLYSNNEPGRVRYRCYAAITARTPDTLRRDDLADRLLVLPMDRISDQHRERETQLEADVLGARGEFWGEILQTLNASVALIRLDKLQGDSTLRLADWEALGRVFSQVLEQADQWPEVVKALKGGQSDFLLQDDLIVEGLAKWLLDREHWGKEMTAREIHEALAGMLFDGQKPPADWPKSTMGFAKRLANIRRDLGALFDVWLGSGSGPEHRDRSCYRFWPKGQRPEQYQIDF